jgi:protein-L-isoaspartate O-methyltransferase
MVDLQLRRRGIRDEHVLNAFRRVRRELFFPSWIGLLGRPDDVAKL